MQKQLEEAQKWEEKLSLRLEKQLSKASPLLFWFSKVQKLKDYHLGDAQLVFSLPKIDYKIRHRKYFRVPADFCIELKTGQKSGWFYTTDNIIYYAWKVNETENPEKNYLIDGYFLNIPFLRTQHENWINEMINRYYRERTYSKSENNERSWKTFNVYVPFREFPNEIIFRFNLDPNPNMRKTNLLEFLS